MYHHILGSCTCLAVPFFPRIHSSVSKKRRLNRHSLRTSASCPFNAVASPPQRASPQVRTDPSARNAAKAPEEAWSRWTFRSRAASPPKRGWPQAATVPSRFRAAKAWREATSCVTWDKPSTGSKVVLGGRQVTTVPSLRRAPKASSEAHSSDTSSSTRNKLGLQVRPQQSTWRWQKDWKPQPRSSYSAIHPILVQRHHSGKSSRFKLMEVPLLPCTHLAILL